MRNGASDRTEGADLIKSCVLLIADQLSLHLGRVEWIQDISGTLDRYTLRVEAITNRGYLPIETARVELDFTRISIATFRSTDTEVTEKQIRPHLMRLREAEQLTMS